MFTYDASPLKKAHDILKQTGSIQSNFLQFVQARPIAIALLVERLTQGPMFEGSNPVIA